MRDCARHLNQREFSVTSAVEHDSRACGLGVARFHEIGLRIKHETVNLVNLM